MKFFATIALMLLPLTVFGQQTKMSKQEQEEEKQFFENIEKELDDLTSRLDLEDWQVFYADSILVNNYTAMKDELKKLEDAKVSNADLYYQVQDKWTEENYNAFHKYLNEQQWEKYLKSGAGKLKKERDKRAAKRNK